MPMTKSRPRRYRRFRRRRMIRKKPSIYRNRFRQTVHFFKKTATLSQIICSQGSSFTPFTEYSKLSDLTDANSLASLYDQYRILAVKFTFFPQFNLVNASSGLDLPTIYTAIDYDRAASPSNPQQIKLYSTSRSQIFTRKHSRYFRPRIYAASAAVSSSPAQAQYGFNMRRTWLDLASLDVQHWGLVGGIAFSSNSVGVGMTVDVDCTMYFQCRNVR